MKPENSVLFMDVREENYTVVTAGSLSHVFPEVVYPSDDYESDVDADLAWDDVEATQLVEQDPELLVRADELRREAVSTRPLEVVAEKLGIPI